MSSLGLEIRPVEAAAVLPLRQAVLRPMQTVAECVYPTDDDPRTLHLGAFGNGELVAVASFAPEPSPGLAGPSAVGPARHFRLRGMAVAPEWQGRRVGAHLLNAACVLLEAADAELLWCNARISACGFYERQGWQQHGAEFEVPPVGPHVVMWRRLA